METKTILIVIIAIVLVLVAIPFVPTVLEGLKSPDSKMDTKNMARIQQAVQTFGEATGNYPASLEALVPDYLAALPTTRGGKAFTYNPRMGAVGLSGATRSNARDSSGSGITPMGDAFTGISVQNELNF